MKWKLAAAGLALATGTMALADPLPEFQQGREGSILGTPAQIEADRRTLRIYNSKQVQAAIDELVAWYEKDPVAELPDARKTLRRAAEAMGRIMDGAAQPAHIAGLLMALALKGERPEEMVGFARAMRSRNWPSSSPFPFSSGSSAMRVSKSQPTMKMRVWAASIRPLATA